MPFAVPTPPTAAATSNTPPAAPAPAPAAAPPAALRVQVLPPSGPSYPTDMLVARAPPIFAVRSKRSSDGKMPMAGIKKKRDEGC